jgi:hypothetical protein
MRLRLLFFGVSRPIVDVDAVTALLAGQPWAGEILTPFHL